MEKEHLKLNEADKKYLTELLNKGQAKGRVIRRAIGLLQLDHGATFQKAAEFLGVDDYTVSIWCKKYVESGLEFLTDLPRSGRPIAFDGEQRAKITALACSETPAGRAKWSMRLLADKAVELELVETISASKVREMLKKTS